jgi:hypothetical protein
MLLNGRTYRIAKASTLRTLTFRKAAANASKLGADPSKGFIVGGISVGGNLASVVSHLAKNKKLSPPLIGIWLDEPNLVTRVWCLRSGGRISRAGSSAKDTPILDQVDLEWYLTVFLLGYFSVWGESIDYV